VTIYVAGATATLSVEWQEYAGGPDTDVTGLTVTVKTLDDDVVVATTSVGVDHTALGRYSFDWSIPAGQGAGSYVVVWDATDAEETAVQASEVIQVAGSVTLVGGIEAITPTSGLLSIGEQWQLRVRATEPPTVVVTLPDGSTTAPAVTVDDDHLRIHLSHHRYEAAYTVTTAGRHLAHVATTTDAVDFAAYVAGPTTAGGMPIADDLATYLGGDDASSWTDDQMTDALAIEAAAQRSVCRVGAVYPDDLRGALLRRAQRNLAMRSLPLAIPQGDADSGPTILPGQDPEVRRLERPHRRLPIG
jgi:hypothetical protein